MIDEVICNRIECLKDVNRDATTLSQIGMPCDMLGCAADYEWLVRYAIAVDYLSEEINMQTELVSFEFSNMPIIETTEEVLFAYAFIISKYADILKDCGLFDAFFMMAFEDAKCVGLDSFFYNKLTFMLKDTSFYGRFEQGPIVILTGDSICCNTLVGFAEELKKAFVEMNQNTMLVSLVTSEVIDVVDYKREMKWRALHCLSPKMVIGFQTTCFSELLLNGMAVGNLFSTPKILFMFDHPVIFLFYAKYSIHNLFMLTLDEGYSRFVKLYMPFFSGVYTIPPAGIEVAEEEKKYSLSFVGKYYDYRLFLNELDKLPEKEQIRGYRVFGKMQDNPNLSFEEALIVVLKEEGITLDSLEKGEFAYMLYKLRAARGAIRNYFREEVVKTILNAEIDIDVFSYDWRLCPMASSPFLHIHPEVDWREGCKVFSQSELSLNVMSWHKEGMTERIANIMLNKCVCVSDSSTYLQENFVNEKDIVLFDLNNLYSLPQMIKGLLGEDNKERRNLIVENAYEKASHVHKWINRAKQIMDILY